MRIRTRAVAIIATSGMSAALLALPAVADTNHAAHSPAPSASPTASKKPGLTADQRVALAAAQSAYATAVANARDGFSRAVADAKSVMDQSIAAAGKDKAAIALAKQTFKDSYNQIFQALSASLNSAKAAYEAAKQAIN